MFSKNLAILGGDPLRKKPFSSKPMIDNDELTLVNQLMKKGQFSKFVGSPLPGSEELLNKKSIDLEIENVSPNVLGGEYVRKFEG